ncbi:hypothetical protein [Kitasatospora sp. NPDC094011]|uniref:hypothetical protein n=1 Tax=Kitasatospora sp. NPDC094011 TaxID=3364090 RepID=UPI0037F926E9
MRLRAVALVVGLAVGSALAGCSGGGPAGGGPAGAAPTPLPLRLSDLLPTAGQLPPGFKLLTDSSAATPEIRRSIATAPCTDLVADHFLSVHSRPSEVASVSLEKPPVGSDFQDRWYGEETLGRYGPNEAEGFMRAVRDTAQSCASYHTVLPGDDSSTAVTVSTRDAGVPADEGLVLRTSMAEPSGTWVAEVAFVREGNVILTVDTVLEEEPGFGVDAVLPAVVTAYRDKS